MCISNIQNLTLQITSEISFHALNQQEDKTPQVQGAFKKSVLVCSYNTESTIGSKYFDSESDTTLINVDFRNFADNQLHFSILSMLTV